MNTFSNSEFLKKLKARKATQEAVDFSGLNLTNDEFDLIANQAYAEAYLNNSAVATGNDEEVQNLLEKIKIENSQATNNFSNTENVIDNSNKKINGRQRTVQTVQHGYYNLVDGFLDFFEGIGDFLVSAVTTPLEWMGVNVDGAKQFLSYDWSKAGAQVFSNVSHLANPYTYSQGARDLSSEGLEEYSNTMNENLLSLASPDISRVVGNIESAVGQMIPSIIIDILTFGASGQTAATVAGIGTKETIKAVAKQTSKQAVRKAVDVAIMSTSAAGHGVEEALKENGDVSVGTATLYGLASGGVEFVTEYAGEWLTKGLGKITSGTKLGNITKNYVLNKLPNSVNGWLGKETSKSVVSQISKEFIEEGLEEVESDLLNPLIKTIYNGKSVRENYQDLNVTDLLESFLVGGVSSAIIGGTSNVVSGTTNKYTRRINIELENSRDTYYKMNEMLVNNEAYELDENGNIITDENGDVIYNREFNELLGQLLEYQNNVEKLADELKDSKKELDKVTKYFFNGTVDQVAQQQVNNIQSSIDMLNYAKSLTTDPEEIRKFDNSIAGYNDMLNLWNNSAKELVLNNLKENTTKFYKETLTFLGNKSGDLVRFRNSYNSFSTALDKLTTRKKYTRLNQNEENYFKNTKTELSNSINQILNSQNKNNKEVVYKIYSGIKGIGEEFVEDNINGATNINEALEEWKDNLKSEDLIYFIESNEIYDFLKKNNYKNVNVVYKNLEDNMFGEINYNNRKANITINKKKNNLLPTFAHEFFSHYLVDNINTEERNNIFEKIRQTEWYKNNADRVYLAYIDSKGKLNFDTFTDEQKNTFTSEIIARYIQDLFSENNARIIKEQSELVDALTKKLAAFTAQTENTEEPKTETVEKEIADELRAALKSAEKEIKANQKEINKKNEKIDKLSNKNKDLNTKLKESLKVNSKSLNQYKKLLNIFEKNIKLNENQKLKLLEVIEKIKKDEFITNNERMRRKLGIFQSFLKNEMVYYPDSDIAYDNDFNVYVNLSAVSDITETCDSLNTFETIKITSDPEIENYKTIVFDSFANLLFLQDYLEIYETNPKPINQERKVAVKNPELNTFQVVEKGDNLKTISKKLFDNLNKSRVIVPIQVALTNTQAGLQSTLKDFLEPLKDKKGNVVKTVRELTESFAHELRVQGNVAASDILDGLPKYRVLDTGEVEAVVDDNGIQTKTQSIKDSFKKIEDYVRDIWKINLTLLPKKSPTFCK